MKFVAAIILLLSLQALSAFAGEKTDLETTSFWMGTCLDEDALKDAIPAEYGIHQDSLIGKEKSLSATIIEKWLKGQSLVSVRRIPSERNWVGKKNWGSKCSYFFSKLGNEPKLNLTQQELSKKRDEIFSHFQSKKIDLIKFEVYNCRETFEYNPFKNNPLISRKLTEVIEQNYRIAATITSEDEQHQCLYVFVRNLNDVAL